MLQQYISANSVASWFSHNFIQKSLKFLEFMGGKMLVMGSMGEKRAVIDLSTNNRTECVLDTVGNSSLEGGAGETLELWLLAFRWGAILPGMVEFEQGVKGFGRRNKKHALFGVSFSEWRFGWCEIDRILIVIVSHGGIWSSLIVVKKLNVLRACFNSFDSGGLNLPNQTSKFRRKLTILVWSSK